MANHPFVHIEIPSGDLEASSTFYSELFGWQVQHHPEMGYATFIAEGGPGGGFPKIDGENVKAGDIKVYVGTDDIEATLAHAEELGAQTITPKTQIPGYGYFAFFLDPFGTPIGLFSM